MNEQRALRRMIIAGASLLVGFVLIALEAADWISAIATGLVAAGVGVAGLTLIIDTRRLWRASEERRAASIVDDLTGLANRRLLFERLRAFFDRPAGDRGTAAFLYVDLNRFKEINDSFGHSTGDEVLRQVGPRLARSLRGSDVLARLGGDEFGVVLFDSDADDATAVAERILASLEEPFVVDGVRASLGASVGIAVAPTDATEPDGLVRCADSAMYRAKLGEQNVATYDRRIDFAGDPRRLAAELREALQRDELVLHYQPVLDVRRGAIAGAEALIRWSHDRLGAVPPARLLGVAEEAGLMPEVTRFALGRAVEQCSVWRDSYPEMKVSINVSPSNLLDDGFVAIVASTLAHCDLPASALVVEITETSVISDFDRSTAVIQELGNLGVTVSIDDFGTGFTALSHLSRFAVRELKIDQVFVSKLASTDKGRDLDFVRSTIELGHSLGLRVVAEGVEDAGTLELLGVLGCDLVQGHFIGRPVPAEELCFAPWPRETSATVS
jgi:diguanylate cyclase (GGDEF)-like protein